MALYVVECPVHGRIEVKMSMSLMLESGLACPVITDGKTCQEKVRRVYSEEDVVIAIPRRFLNGFTKADIMGD